MTVGRVGDRVDAADVAGGRVRVDRDYSPLGNPFVLGGEIDRDPACNAYELLLEATLGVGRARTVEGWTPSAIGAACGFRGEVRGWDWDAALDEMRRLRLLAGRGSLRLDCHCWPKRCHGESVRKHVMGRFH